MSSIYYIHFDYCAYVKCYLSKKLQVLLPASYCHGNINVLR